MADNVVSLEEYRLAKLGNTPSCSNENVLIMAKTIAELEARIMERDAVRDCIEHMEIGDVMLHTHDGSVPSPLPLAHLVDLLSGYDDLLTRHIATLEYRKEILDLPLDG